jgi:hypothetical protein
MQMSEFNQDKNISQRLSPHKSRSNAELESYGTSCIRFGRTCIYSQVRPTPCEQLLLLGSVYLGN